MRGIVGLLVVVAPISCHSAAAWADDARLLAQCECYIKSVIMAPLSYQQIKSSVAPAPYESGGKSRIDVLFEALTTGGQTERGYAVCLAFNSGAGVTSLEINGQKIPHDIEYLLATTKCDQLGN